MAVKSARDSFSAQEIREILERNVRLYKDESGFVEYFVDLVTYLLESHDGERHVGPELPPVPPKPRSQPTDESKELMAADAGWRAKVVSTRASYSGKAPSPFVEPIGGSRQIAAAKASLPEDTSDIERKPSEPRPIPKPTDLKNRQTPLAVSHEIGKLQVYRAVSNFKSTTEDEIPCRVCGTLLPRTMKMCPGCGNANT